MWWSGLRLAWYPRLTQDIDLLIQEEDLQRVLGILLKLKVSTFLLA